MASLSPVCRAPVTYLPTLRHLSYPLGLSEPWHNCKSDATVQDHSEHFHPAMSHGPPPSQLCLLSELPARDVGDKVRFLGCVISYSTSKACLELRHMHPPGAEVVTAMADVNLLLERLHHEQTAVGSWVNVIGYVKAKSKRKRSTTSTRHTDKDDAGTWVVHVQAVMLWPTGPLDVQLYEKAVANDATSKQ